jgi:hypothetical protein
MTAFWDFRASSNTHGCNVIQIHYGRGDSLHARSSVSNTTRRGASFEAHIFIELCRVEGSEHLTRCAADFKGYRGLVRRNNPDWVLCVACGKVSRKFCKPNSIDGD